MDQGTSHVTHKTTLSEMVVLVTCTTLALAVPWRGMSGTGLLRYALHGRECAELLSSVHVMMCLMSLVLYVVSRCSGRVFAQMISGALGMFSILLVVAGRFVIAVSSNRWCVGDGALPMLSDRWIFHAKSSIFLAVAVANGLGLIVGIRRRLSLKEVDLFVPFALGVGSSIWVVEHPPAFFLFFAANVSLWSRMRELGAAQVQCVLMSMASIFMLVVGVLSR